MVIKSDARLKEINRVKGEVERIMSEKSDNVLQFEFNQDYPILTHGKGIYVYDVNGKEYIDGTSGSISSSLGHGRSDMGQAIAEQASKIAYINRHVASSEILQKAAEKMHEVTGLDKFFTVSGGTEANEIATKIARLHFYHQGKREKNKIIGRWQSYHGYSVDTLSFGGHVGRRKEFVSYLREDGHIAPPYCYRCWYGKEEGCCDFECANALETEILERGPENIAGFISETVCGTALNAAVAPVGYYKRIREICDEYDVLMINDEIMSGAGRTGTMLAIEHYGVKPDIVSLAKSIGGGYFPVGVACCTQEVLNPIIEFGSFSPGYTWAGNPLAAAVIIKTLDVFKEEKLMENVKAQGDYLIKSLLSMKNRHPSIGDIRGKGLLVGVEFVRNKETKECFDPKVLYSARIADAAQKLGLCLMATGGFDKGWRGNGILMSPCFEVTKEEIDKILDRFESAVTVVESTLEMEFF